MSHTYQVPSPPDSPSPPPRQSKAIMQKHYREKEGESFNALRDVIKRLTGEELVTRQEILRKAIDLLLYLQEIKKQEQVPVVLPAPDEMTVTKVTNIANTALNPLGHSTRSSHWPQPWQNVEFDVQSAYYPAQFHSQQFTTMSSMDPAFEQASYQEFGKNWPDDPPL